jgi:hypothetical protein
MWATLALMAALGSAPAQNPAQELRLDNVRETYGILGQKRPDNKLLPGDVYVVAFDIMNLQVKDDGKVQYSMGMELLDKDKKTQYKKEPNELEAVNSLGGSRIPSFALSVIGTDTPPGKYTMIVTVKDHAANKSKQLTRDFEVLKTQFGFIRVGLTYDGGTVPAPPVAVPGQTYWVNFNLVGFELSKDKDPAKQHPDVSVEMRIIDMDTGKPTVAKPSTGRVTELNPEVKNVLLFLPFPINLNRAGKFKIELKATDNLAKKTVEQTLEFTVTEVK